MLRRRSKCAFASVDGAMLYWFEVKASTQRVLSLRFFLGQILDGCGLEASQEVVAQTFDGIIFEFLNHSRAC